MSSCTCETFGHCQVCEPQRRAHQPQLFEPMTMEQMQAGAALAADLLRSVGITWRPADTVETGGRL